MHRHHRSRTFFAALLASSALPLTGSSEVTFTALTGTLFATDVSADGSVVVGRSSTGVASFRRTRSGGFGALGEPANVMISDANGVSDNGAVVAGTLTFASSAGSPSQSYRWTDATGMVPLGVPSGSTTSAAFGISGDGAVIVGNALGGLGSDAYRWTSGGGFQTIANGWVYGANGDGSVITGTLLTSASGREAFRWGDPKGSCR